MRKILVILLLLLNSDLISNSFGQSSGCLAIEDVGTLEPARTRLFQGPILSNVNTTCFGFTGSFSLPRYTGAPIANPNKCQWNGTTGRPNCLTVNPISGAWVCGTTGTFTLVACPLDSYSLLLFFILAMTGFIIIRRMEINIQQ